MYCTSTFALCVTVFMRSFLHHQIMLIFLVHSIEIKAHSLKVVHTFQLNVFVKLGTVFLVQLNGISFMPNAVSAGVFELIRKWADEIDHWHSKQGNSTPFQYHGNKALNGRKCKKHTYCISKAFAFLAAFCTHSRIFSHFHVHFQLLLTIPSSSSTYTSL